MSNYDSHSVLFLFTVTNSMDEQLKNELEAERDALRNRAIVSGSGEIKTRLSELFNKSNISEPFIVNPMNLGDITSPSPSSASAHGGNEKLESMCQVIVDKISFMEGEISEVKQMIHPPHAHPLLPPPIVTPPPPTPMEQSKIRHRKGSRYVGTNKLNPWTRELMAMVRANRR